MKIPFDIKFRPQIESGEYKVETRDGKKVRVLCYNANNIVPIVALVTFNDGSEGSRDYYSDGTMNRDRENPLDLFIVTPEEELTEFEKVVRDALEYDPDLPTEEEIVTAVKEYASELLALAREELIKDGYVIEKKAFHDAVEKVSPEVMKEVSENIGQLDALEQYRKGREDALKDLPRWRVSNAMRSTLPTVMYGNNGMILYKDGLEVSISDLEKLPKDE